MLVLFDVDNTLIDHGAAFRAATEALCARVGSPGSLEAFGLVWSAVHRHYFDRYLAGEAAV